MIIAETDHLYEHMKSDGSLCSRCRTQPPEESIVDLRHPRGCGGLFYFVFCEACVEAARNQSLMKFPILETDYLFVKTNDATCSRCRQPIGEGDVPLCLWPQGGGGELMYQFCEPCVRKAGLFS